MTDNDLSVLDVEFESDPPELEVDFYPETVISTDYNTLQNKPSINGVELVGDKSSADLHIDRTYVFEQNSAAAVWSITHNLGKYPSVSVVDSAGTVCVGEVTYIDENSLICTFTAPFSGKAYLN